MATSVKQAGPYDDEDEETSEGAEQKRFNREFEDIVSHYDDDNTPHRSASNIKQASPWDDDKRASGDKRQRFGLGSNKINEPYDKDNKKAGEGEHTGKHRGEYKGKHRKPTDDDDKVGRGFTTGAGAGAVGIGGRLAGFFFGSKTRRTTTISGTVITAVVVGFGMYNFFSLDGFEFIQEAHILEQIHLATQQDESNDRVGKLMRDIRYVKQHKLYRSNMNFIGNNIADRVEARLNSQGLESAYSKYLGLKQGYFIDRAAPMWKNLDDKQITQFVHDNMGAKIKVVKLSDGRLLIVQPSGYRASLKITSFILQQQGMNRVMAAMLAHVMGVRDGITWHPLTKLDNKFYLPLKEKLIEWTKDKLDNIRNGTTDSQIAAKDKASKKKGRASAKDQAAKAEQLASEGDGANQDVSTGSDAKVQKLSVKLGSLTLASAGGAATVLCIARGLASNAASLKQQQVALPLVRIAGRAQSEAHQIEYGKSDIDAQQVQLDAKQQFYDPNNHSTWYDSEAIQWGLGHINTGIAPTETLLNLAKGTPFDFLLAGAWNRVLSPVCSGVGQGALTVISFLGGPFSALGSLIAGQTLGPILFGAIAHWMAGDAADVNSKGAAYGSNASFGTHILANDQAISSAMPPLTNPEKVQLSQINQDQMQAEFDSHSFAYRLLSPTDSRTYMASVIDHISPSITDNITSIVFGILNIKNSIFNVFSSIFSHSLVHAASNLTYPYGGTDTYAMSVADMDNPLVANPYQNADAVAVILSGPNGQNYIDRALKCTGDTLTLMPGSNGSKVEKWDVQFGQSGVNVFSPEYKAIKAECADFKDPNWLRICFFIFDTQNMKALDCYMGKTSTSSQSCTDIGILNG